MTHTELIAAQRFLIILDCSNSMQGAHLEQAKLGVNFWLDYVNPGDQLGLITFSTKPKVNIPLSSVPSLKATARSWRKIRHGKVSRLEAGGDSAIGEALRTGLRLFRSRGRAATQVMILLTTGHEKGTAETVEQVLPDLIASGSLCYTIGLGKNQNASLLAHLARNTGAEYFAIDEGLSTGEGAIAISEALIQLAGISADNAGIVSFQDLDRVSVVSAKANSEEKPALPFTFEDDRGTSIIRQSSESFRFPVSITDSTNRCTLGVLWKDTARRFRIRIWDPDDKELHKRRGTRWVEPKNYPFAFCKIDKPKSGVWHVEVHGSAFHTTSFRTLGFEVNNQIRLEAGPDETHVRCGNEIKLEARLLIPFPVPGVRMTGWVRRPLESKWREFEFNEIDSDRCCNGGSFYSGCISSDESGQYLIAVDAYREEGEIEIKFVDYFRKESRSRTFIHNISVPIRRKMFFTVTADREGCSSAALRCGENNRPPWRPKKQRVQKRRQRLRPTVGYA